MQTYPATLAQMRRSVTFTQQALRVLWDACDHFERQNIPVGDIDRAIEELRQVTDHVASAIRALASDPAADALRDWLTGGDPPP